VAKIKRHLYRKSKRRLITILTELSYNTQTTQSKNKAEVPRITKKITVVVIVAAMMMMMMMMMMTTTTSKHRVLAPGFVLTGIPGNFNYHLLRLMIIITVSDSAQRGFVNLSLKEIESTHPSITQRKTVHLTTL